MKIALFQDVDADEGYGLCIDEQTREGDGYVRISGYVEVEFPPLEPEAVESQMEEIERVRSWRERWFNDACRMIEQRRTALEAQSTGS